MANKYLLSFCYFAQISIILNIHFTGAFDLPQINKSLPDPTLISKILNQFFGKVVRSFPQNSLPLKESLVDKAIRDKVEELQPFLQDDMIANDKNLMLEDNDDTTIIEFLPKTEERRKMIEEESFKSNLNKYKKIREKINTALTKESVSIETKKIVFKTLDGLMKYLLSSQCKWKRNLRAVNSKPSDIAKKWNSGLQNIKDDLFSFVENRPVKSRRNGDVLKILEAIQVMFQSITEDIDTISRKYKILCDFVPKEYNSNAKSGEMNSSALRNTWDKTDLEEDRCQNLVICSSELTEFMKNFHYTLNDTAVSVLRNYVEMYKNDVNVDYENEKGIITSLLNKITRSLEAGITNVFVRETQKLTLDNKKNNQENLRAISNYVINTIGSVKDFAKQLLKSELPLLREKVLAVIMDDLKVNLDVDLGNLEREFLSKICAIFRLCNSRYEGRRQSNSLNKNSLHVQLELTLDNDMADMNSNRKFLNIATQENSNRKRYTSFTTNVTVTRTTLFNNSTYKH